MKVSLHLISDSDKHFGSACDEYTKRLGNAIKIYAHKPVKYGTTQQIIEQETHLLLSKINTKHPCIVLNPQGEERATKKRHKKLYGKNIQIVIGGPYGIEYSQFAFATHVSLGKHTMPHGLAKLVMLEQCYRVWTFGMNKKYHY